MYIDCDNYLILARTGHRAEMHLVKQDHAVGLSEAKRRARALTLKHPGARVEIFLCKGHSRFLVG